MNEVMSEAVTFNEDTHTYRYGDRIIPSVSSILNKVLGTSYGNVPEAILKKACEKGELVHKEVQDYEEKGEIGFTEEFSQYLELKKRHHFKPVEIEKMVYCLEDVMQFAGRFDMATEDTLIDIKTTYKLDTVRTMWQLNLYNFCEKMKYKKLAVIWLRPDKAEYVELERKEAVEIACGFLDRYLSGQTLSQEVVELNCLDLTSHESLTDCLRKIKLFEEQVDDIRAKILEEMKERGIKKYDDGVLSISYIDALEKHTIDTTALKEKYPDIAEELTKTTKQKESIKIKIKESK